MKTVLILGLIGAAGYAVWKYHHQAALQLRGSLQAIMPDLGGAPAGVPQFTPVIVPNTPGQLQAWSEQIPEGTTSGLYSPAFGESSVDQIA